MVPRLDTAWCGHVFGVSGGLAMPDAATAHANLVNVPSMHEQNIDRVEPNEPANSYLVQKLAGTQAGIGIGNVQMPNTARSS